MSACKLLNFKKEEIYPWGVFLKYFTPWVVFFLKFSGHTKTLQTCKETMSDYYKDDANPFYKPHKIGADLVCLGAIQHNYLPNYWCESGKQGVIR